MSGARAWDVVEELATYLRPGPGPSADPDSGWPALLALADRHRLQPALWSALRTRGVGSLPAALADRGDAPLAVLARAHRENAARVDDLRSQAVLVLDALAAAGVDAVPLKGAHWLLAGWLPDPAARVTVDVDVLVPRADVEAAVAAVVAAGYAPAPVHPADADLGDHQVPALVLPGRPGSVELHVAPFRRRRRPVLTADEVLAHAVATDVDGTARRLPDPAHALVLLAGHAQLQDAGARLLELPLRALADLAQLRAGGRVTDDWDRAWSAAASRFAAAGPGAAAAFDGFAAAAGLVDVELRHGRTGAGWCRAVRAATEHPGPAAVLREAVCLPQALRPARMEALHGASAGLPLLLARLRHVGAGATRRMRPR